MDKAKTQLRCGQQKFWWKHESIVPSAMCADLQMESAALCTKRCKKCPMGSEQFNDIRKYIFDGILVRLVLTMIKRIASPVTLSVNAAECSALFRDSRIASPRFMAGR